MAPQKPIERGTRAVILCLRAIGTPGKEIQKLVGSPISSINGLYNSAIKRGFNPEARPLDFNEYIGESTPRRTPESKVTKTGAKKEYVLTEKASKPGLIINEHSPATPTPRSRTSRKKVKAAEPTEENPDVSRETSHETEESGMDLEEDCVPLIKEERECVPFSKV